MINYIFGLMILIGIIFSFINGTTNQVMDAIIKSGNDTLNIIMTMLPITALWLGIINIASSSGLLKKVTKVIKKILQILFPNIPLNHKALEYISTNIVMNMFGLGNAATPVGIKAISEMKKISSNDKASDDMITFLIMNTTGFTLIPTTIIGYRMIYGSNNYGIIPIIVLSSFLALIIGLIINRLLRCLKW